MTEALTTRQTATDPAAQTMSSASQEIVASPAPNLEHTKIQSNFTQSPSTYWALALPLLSGRYFAEAINGVVKPLHKFNAKQLGSVLEEASSKAEETVNRAEFKDKAWAFAVGVSMVGVTGFYTASTYGDMKRQFKEAVGWELDKEPEKVTFIDMLRSKNILVSDAAKNLASRTAKRLAVHLPFFFMFAPSPFKVVETEKGMKATLRRPFEKETTHIKLGDTVYDKFLGPTDSVKFGVGTNALYLASDALGRKRTSYEELQTMTDTKINHRDTLGQVITAQDIINLYDRQVRRHGAQMPKMNTEQWQNDVKLFEHMADLMNQTYGNEPQKGYADFTIPKLIYLMGMGLIKSDQPEKARAYIEVANRYGIPAVKKVAADINSGVALETALAPFPVALEACVPQPLQATGADNAMLSSMGIAPEPAAVPANTVKSFASEGLKRLRPEAPPATHVEKAAQSSEAAAGLSL